MDSRRARHEGGFAETSDHCREIGFRSERTCTADQAAGTLEGSRLKLEAEQAVALIGTGQPKQAGLL